MVTQRLTLKQYRREQKTTRASERKRESSFQRERRDALRSRDIRTKLASGVTKSGGAVIDSKTGLKRAMTYKDIELRNNQGTIKEGVTAVGKTKVKGTKKIVPVYKREKGVLLGGKLVADSSEPLATIEALKQVTGRYQRISDKKLITGLNIARLKKSTISKLVGPTPSKVYERTGLDISGPVKYTKLRDDTAITRVTSKLERSRKGVRSLLRDPDVSTTKKTAIAIASLGSATLTGILDSVQFLADVGKLSITQTKKFKTLMKTKEGRNAIASNIKKAGLSTAKFSRRYILDANYRMDLDKKLRNLVLLVGITYKKDFMKDPLGTIGKTAGSILTFGAITKTAGGVRKLASTVVKQIKAASMGVAKQSKLIYKANKLIANGRPVDSSLFRSIPDKNFRYVIKDQVGNPVFTTSKGLKQLRKVFKSRLPAKALDRDLIKQFVRYQRPIKKEIQRQLNKSVIANRVKLRQSEISQARKLKRIGKIPKATRLDVTMDYVGLIKGKQVIVRNLSFKDYIKLVRAEIRFIKKNSSAYAKKLSELTQKQRLLIQKQYEKSLRLLKEGKLLSSDDLESFKIFILNLKKGTAELNKSLIKIKSSLKSKKLNRRIIGFNKNNKPVRGYSYFDIKSGKLKYYFSRKKYISDVGKQSKFLDSKEGFDFITKTKQGARSYDKLKQIEKSGIKEQFLNEKDIIVRSRTTKPRTPIESFKKTKQKSKIIKEITKRDGKVAVTSDGNIKTYKKVEIVKGNQKQVSYQLVDQTTVNTKNAKNLLIRKPKVKHALNELQTGEVKLSKVNTFTLKDLSLTGLNKLFSILNNKSIIVNSLNKIMPKNSYLNLLSVIPSIVIVSGIKTIPDSVNIVNSKSDLSKLQKFMQSVKPTLKQKLIPATKPKKTTKPKIIKSVKEKPKKKAIKPSIKLNWDTKLPKGYSRLVNIIVRVRGKNKEFETKTTPNRALKIVAKLVDNTTNRSFQLKVVGYKKVQDIKKQNLSKFRMKKSKGTPVLKFVEKTKYAIDTRGEKQGLRVSRLLKKSRG